MWIALLFCVALGRLVAASEQNAVVRRLAGEDTGTLLLLDIERNTTDRSLG